MDVYPVKDNIVRHLRQGILIGPEQDDVKNLWNLWINRELDPDKTEVMSAIERSHTTQAWVRVSG